MLSICQREKVTSFKAKDSEIKPYPFCLGHIPVAFNESITDPGLFGYVYDFSVDYQAIAKDKILDIHKYLMEKNGIV